MSGLTARFCASVEANEKSAEFRDTKEPGLIFRVWPSGRKSWAMLYYRPGSKKRARLTLGKYPEVSLEAARSKARAAKVALDQGDDPQAVRDDRVVISSFDDLADLYLERYAKPRKRSWARDEALLAGYIRPAIGELPVGRVTKRQVLDIIEAIKDKGAPVQAERVYEVVRGVYRWGLAEDLIDHDPTHGIKRKRRYVPRTRALDDDEISAFWSGLEGSGMDARAVLALKLALVTGQRIGEICGARIDEFDLERGVWSLPADRAKNGHAHTVPLTALSISLVRDAIDRHAGDTYLLASAPRAKAVAEPREQPLLPSSVTKAMQRHLGDLGLADNPATPHDLRRTVATHLAASGVEPHLTSRILNHVSEFQNSVTAAVYVKYAYADEKRAALAAWDTKLRGLIGHPSDNVLPFRETVR